MTISKQFVTWEIYGDCSVTCGNGTQNYYRKCDSPVPGNGGSFCVGNSTNAMPCYKNGCPGEYKLLRYSHGYQVITNCLDNDPPFPGTGLSHFL
jgi:hypothetical protein